MVDLVLAKHPEMMMCKTSCMYIGSVVVKKQNPAKKILNLNVENLMKLQILTYLCLTESRTER